jgi:hypothetical protein
MLKFIQYNDFILQQICVNLQIIDFSKFYSSYPLLLTLIPMVISLFLHFNEQH